MNHFYKTHIIAIQLICSILLLYSCKKYPTTPDVVTTNVTDITYTTAVTGGIVTNKGGPDVIARGVCWSTTERPTLANNVTSDGSDTGSFVSILTNLIPNTKYYVKAYATNSVGTGYGNQVSFISKPITLPSISTTSISSITSTGAVSGGNITSDGGDSITSRGVCWGLEFNPTIFDNKTIDGKGTGSFLSDITDLTTFTTYYVRAYATNSAGTAYGNQITFTSAGTVEDYDGNVYNAVSIGSQIWMAENLKTTKFNTGTDIILVTNNTAWKNLDTQGYCWYDNDEATNKDTYGALYNWYAVNGDSICPIGWHMPTDEEWTTLSNYLGGESVAGGKLKEMGNEHWVFDNIGATNETSYTALPGGYRDGRNIGVGTFDNIGISGYWWSSTEFDLNNSWTRILAANYNGIVRTKNDKSFGFSVRCIKDN